MMKLPPREIKALREIAEFKGEYSQQWTKATCNKLPGLGLIESSTPGWRITAVGKEALMKVTG